MWATQLILFHVDRYILHSFTICSAKVLTDLCGFLVEALCSFIASLLVWSNTLVKSKRAKRAPLTSLTVEHLRRQVGQSERESIKSLFSQPIDENSLDPPVPGPIQNGKQLVIWRELDIESFLLFPRILSERWWWTVVAGGRDVGTGKDRARIERYIIISEEGFWDIRRSVLNPYSWWIA